MSGTSGLLHGFQYLIFITLCIVVIICAFYVKNGKAQSPPGPRWYPPGERISEPRRGNRSPWSSPVDPPARPTITKVCYYLADHRRIVIYWTLPYGHNPHSFTISIYSGGELALNPVIAGGRDREREVRLIPGVTYSAIVTANYSRSSKDSQVYANWTIPL